MKINQIITMFSALVVLSGCAKQEIDFETVDSIRYKVRCSNIAPDVQVKSSTLSFNGSDIPLFFSQVQDINLASVSETVSADTRATLINNNDNGDRSPIAAEDGISTFIASAYSATSAVYEGESVNWDGSAWKTGTNYRWPENASLKFYSFANLPQNGTEVNITSDGISMSHTVQTAAAEQKDILLGYYEGTGNPEGTADIDFDHPLTAVIIKAGQIDGMKAITSVKVSGLISEGTFTMQKSVDDGDSSWEVPEAETYTTIITQSNTGGLPIDEEDRMIGEPLVLIPQNLEAHPVKLEVKLIIASNTAGKTTEVTVTADLNEGEWEQGCTNIYTVGFDAYAYDFSLKTASDANTTFYGSESAETKTISLNSNKYLTTTAIQQSWVIKSYQIGNSAPVEVGGNTFEDGGLSVTNTSSSTAAQLKIEAAARSNRINRGNHDYWVGDNGAWSPSEWNDKGVIDLSRMDFSKDAYDSAAGAHDMTTANCYIIRHAGKYKLPLVYGNGVVNGIENTKSYYPNLTTSATNVLKRFANHNHTGGMYEGNITSAFIENNEGCGGENLKCAVVWQDQGVVLTNLTLDAYSEVGGSYNTGNVRYLNFEVPQSNICQNNALVCIYFDGDSDGEYDEGEAVWSWHIWVTNDPALLDNPIEVLSPGGVKYDFLPINVIGQISEDELVGREDVLITLQQESSEYELEVLVRQLDNTPPPTGTFYQFGKKDPICRIDEPADGAFVKKTVGWVNIPTAICSPGTFFYGQYTTSGEVFNWCKENYCNLWTGRFISDDDAFEQTESMIKTIYDPSPVGYKIPANKSYTRFTTTNTNTSKDSEFNVLGTFHYGWEFYTQENKRGKTAFFLATGYRNGHDGKVTNRGTFGYTWSAVSQSKDLGYYLNFSNSYVFPLSSSGKAHGFPVRPVKEN